jgi:D-lactate dehydrogenase
VPAALDQERRDRLQEIEILDSISWVHDRLLGGLEIGSRVPSLALHVPCASMHLGLQPQLRAIAQALANEVVEPASGGCCGMAGDRGLLHPELPQSALSETAALVAEKRPSACMCSNRTCEIALERATGEPFASFPLLLERATRP